MAAFLNLLLALAFALILPVMQRMAPAVASGAASPQVPAALAPPAEPLEWNWSVARGERRGSSTETRHVRVVVGEMQATAPCELRFIALPKPPAPARATISTDA